MTHLLRCRLSPVAGLLFSVLCLLSFGPQLAAAPIAFDIPAQPAPAALDLFIKQSRAQVVYLQDDVTGVRTNALNGEFEPKAALEQLLKDTGLTCTERKAGQFTVGRAPAKTGAVKGRVLNSNVGQPVSGAHIEIDGTALTTTTDRDGNFEFAAVVPGNYSLAVSAAGLRPVRVTDLLVRAGQTIEFASVQMHPAFAADGVAQMEPLEVAASQLMMLMMPQYEVTGSRIRTLTGEQTFQPMTTLDRQQIDRTGVTTFGDLFRYIPQVTSSSNGRPASGGGQQIAGYSMLDTATGLTATLRGFDSASTLILVDGRRATKTNQNSAARYDVMGMPLASVDRVEVLLDGASAIYGADAVGGVINIITRKNYSGTELRFGYDNMFTTDAAQRSVALTHGFAKRKWSGLVSLSFEDNTSLSNQDTWYNRSSDRRSLGAPTDGRSTTLTEGTGYIRTVNGANLPGLTSPRAAIPSGSNGRNVTVADYANAGPIGAPFDYSAYVYQPLTQERGGSFKLEYRHRPWLAAFVEGRGTKTRTKGMTDYRYYNISSVTLPVGYPGNPFGVPIVGVKVFFDEDPVVTLTRSTVSLTGGFRGDLPRGWRYDSGVTVQRSDATQDYPYTSLNSTAAQAAVNGANPPILLYDSLRVKSPNAPGTLYSISSPSVASRRELPVTWNYDFNADGPIWTLPAGDVKLAFGAEAREEYVDFKITRNTVTPTTPFPGVKRSTVGVYAETRIPVIAAKQQWKFLHRLDLSLAVRRDSYSDEPASTNPSVGLQLQPVKWISLRANYGEGYRVPDLTSRYRPLSVFTTTTPVTSRVDPLRGNQVVPVPYTFYTIGNPDLEPETFQSQTAGVAVDVPFVKGLSFSGGWWKTDYLNRISGSGVYTFDEQVLRFPQWFTRGPNLPGDLPGWPGPIVGILSMSINVGEAKLAGWDATVKYDRATPWGHFMMRADASKTTRNNLYPRPGQPPTAASGTYALPFQASGSLFWNRGAIDTGVLFTYRESFRTSPTQPQYASAIRWDWEGSYNFDQNAWLQKRAGGWIKRAFAGTKLSVTVINVLNADPTRVNGVFNFSVIDARLRHYALQATKKF